MSKNAVESVELRWRIKLEDKRTMRHVASVLRKSEGRLAGEGGACELLGVSHRTFMRWLRMMPHLEAMVNEARSATLDE